VVHLTPVVIVVIEIHPVVVKEINYRYIKNDNIIFYRLIILNSLVLNHCGIREWSTIYICIIYLYMHGVQKLK